MSTLNLDKPHKETSTLIEFALGEFPGKVFHRITDSTTNIVHQGDLFLSVPSVKVILPPRSGGLNEKPAELELALSGNPFQTIDDFMEAISKGHAFVPVWVTIMELVKTDKSENETQIYFLYSGRLVRTFRNPSGKSNIVQMKIANEKLDLEIALGMPADFKCGNTFGGAGCYLNLSSHKVDNCWLEGNAGFQIQIAHANLTLITSPPFEIDAWSMGFIIKDGLSILIREHKGATRDLILTQVPPDDWFGTSSKEITLVPGCRKMVEHCRNRVNTEHFNGVGFGIPTHNPVFEEKNV